MLQAKPRIQALAAAVLMAIGGIAYAQTSGMTGGGPSTDVTGTTSSGTTGSATSATPAQPVAPQPGRTQAAPLAPSPGMLGTQPGQTAIGQAARIPSRSDSAAVAFQSLDPSKRGYVTRAETDRLDGFTGFDNADTNRDGQLNSEEFAKAWSSYGTR